MFSIYGRVWSGVCQSRIGKANEKEPTMRGILTCIAVTALMVAAGCERTISERERTTTHRDGTVTRSSETVKEAPDGTIRVEKERNIDR